MSIHFTCLLIFLGRTLQIIIRLPVSNTFHVNKLFISCYLQAVSLIIGVNFYSTIHYVGMFLRHFNTKIPSQGCTACYSFWNAEYSRFNNYILKCNVFIEPTFHTFSSKTVNIQWSLSWSLDSQLYATSWQNLALSIYRC